GVDLIVNKQTGQWGTGYNPSHNLGRAPMNTEVLAAPVDTFTIAVRDGALVMEWGTFRWRAELRTSKADR
ncbi:MAG TPA: DUF2911 domain-containing protein, partial [Gemmatimonadaceae bacterium]|nr:DUF2911 domain-containing protein [Gemmatimonadaceae bacterium]